VITGRVSSRGGVRRWGSGGNSQKSGNQELLKKIIFGFNNTILKIHELEDYY
jgi:hypothetical protein